MTCPQFNIGQTVILTFDNGMTQKGLILNTGGDQFDGADRYHIQPFFESGKKSPFDAWFVWDAEKEHFNSGDMLAVQIAKAKVQ